MSVVYTTFAGMIVHENRGGVERDYMPDPAGNTVALLDSNQNKTDEFEYWPYGELSSKTPTAATPFLFGGIWGYFRDVRDRLTYVRARHYLPSYARWLTVDQSQNVVNTYRHKPYGGLLAKTGVGADPRFLWNGGTGSWATGRVYSEQYNLSRYLSHILASWTSLDSFWPTESAYGYALGSPVSANDPTGMSVTCRNMPPTKLNDCGGAQMFSQWLANKTDNGWVVQKVVIDPSKVSLVNCSGIPRSVPKQVWYEAWKIVNGVIYGCDKKTGGLHLFGPNRVHDTFEFKENWRCHVGQPLLMSGHYMFMRTIKMPPFKCGGVANAGLLLWSTTIKPAGWVDGPINHELKVLFKCCCKGPNPRYPECEKGDVQDTLPTGFCR